MINREKIALDYEGNHFVFYTEPNIAEKQLIKQEAAELLGGIENYSKLSAIADNAYFEHLRHCRNKFGVEELKQKEIHLTELAKGKENSEWEILYQEIYGNQYYLQFLNLTKEQSRVEKYASLIVLCVENKEKINFKERKEEYLEGLLEEVEKKLKFFREQNTKVEEVSKS
jgi:hypothetical protein